MRAVVFALCLAPALAMAQTEERASFYLTSGKDTIFAERMWRTPTELRGEFIDRARGSKMSYVATLAADGSISALTTRFLRSSTDTVGELAMFKVSGDQILATMGSSPTAAKLPAIAGVQLIINPSVAFLEQLILRAKIVKDVDKATVPLFILGAAQPVPAALTFVGADSVGLTYAGVSMKIRVSPEGRFLSGSVSGQPVMLLRGPATDSLMPARKD